MRSCVQHRPGNRSPAEPSEPRSIFTIAGGRITCLQCRARSKRTGQQCRAPAMSGKAVCKTHGGLSSGPKTAEGRSRCAQAKTIHGQETRAARKERSKVLTELNELRELGNLLKIFTEKSKKRGVTTLSAK
jgi:hypothetical protein